MITEAISCLIPACELIYVLPWSIIDTNKEEKIIPIGCEFPNSATAMESNPILVNTFGCIDAKSPK